MRRLCLLAALLLPAFAQAQTLVVEGSPSRLRDLLATHLDLARALERAAKHPNDPSEALDATERARLCQVAPQQARSLLETEGRFAPVRLHMDCEALRFSFDAGPQSTVRKLALRAVKGEDESGVDETEEGANEAEETGSPLRGRWRRALGLSVGDAFTQDAWSAGKRSLLSRIRADGHPMARYRFSDAAVDADAQAVDLRLHLELGPAIRIGRVLFEGLVHHDEERARELLALHPGDAYTEQSLLDAQDRLLKSGLFDNVQVELDAESLSGDAKDQMDVRVRIKESPLQQLGLGLGWQSASGERITLEHQHRRAFGRPLRSTVKMMLAKDSQSASAELSTHPQALLRRNLAGVSWEREQGASVAPYSQAALRIGQVYESRAHDRSVTAELLASRQGLGTLSTRADAALLHFNPTWRTVDNVLLPRRGQAWLLQVGGGQARSSTGPVEEKGGVARLHARWYGYWPIGPGSGGKLLATRLEAGQVWARDSLVLPESLLWRVGGDDSVRGYGRRSLGPMRAGQAVGGRVAWTGSVEWQQPVPKDWSFGLDGIGWAAFVDAGQSARTWNEADPAIGAGVGLRWRSPVGVLRVDLARGQEKYNGGWRMHVSLGMSL